MKQLIFFTLSFVSFSSWANNSFLERSTVYKGLKSILAERKDFAGILTALDNFYRTAPDCPTAYPDQLISRLRKKSGMFDSISEESGKLLILGAMDSWPCASLPGYTVVIKLKVNDPLSIKALWPVYEHIREELKYQKDQIALWTNVFNGIERADISSEESLAGHAEVFRGQLAKANYELSLLLEQRQPLRDEYERVRNMSTDSAWYLLTGLAALVGIALGMAGAPFVVLLVPLIVALGSHSAGFQNSTKLSQEKQAKLKPIGEQITTLANKTLEAGTAAQKSQEQIRIIEQLAQESRATHELEQRLVKP